MNIGLVSVDFYPHVGGIAAHVLELGRALVSAGHVVHVFTVPIGTEPVGTQSLDGMTVHRLGTSLIKPIYTWNTHRTLRSAIDAHNLDVVHVHGLRPLEATRNLTVPVIFTNHSSGFLKRLERGPAQRRRVAKRMTHVAHVLAPSRELAERTKEVGFSGPVDYIPNAVDTDRYQPGPSSYRTAWNVPDASPVLLLARRLVEKNGVVVFAQCLQYLSDLPWTAIFAGDGEERGKVESILSRHHLSDRCRLLGNVASTTMPEIYRSADISVLPSFMEATSITGLESMASSLPLVGTMVGGIPELVNDQETGLLVPPGNPEALAAAIRKLLIDGDLRHQYGRAGRQRVIDHFSWKAMALRTSEIYELYCRRTRAAA